MRITTTTHVLGPGLATIWQEGGEVDRGLGVQFGGNVFLKGILEGNNTHEHHVCSNIQLEGDFRK